MKSSRSKLLHEIAGHSLVKVFGRQGDVEARFDEKNQQLFEAGYGAQFISGPDATTLYGTGYVNGLIKVTTGALE